MQISTICTLNCVCLFVCVCSLVILIKNFTDSVGFVCNKRFCYAILVFQIMTKVLGNLEKLTERL